tara:strand:- start:479 stop:1117 length:639 start_codon:yes stop_codon:yes gene_type:complete
MIISHKYKFICLNPPKTGTGYRERLISKHNSDINLWTEKGITPVRHFNVYKTLEYLKVNNLEDQCGDYLWFSFARNPWTRMESWFNMSLKKKTEEEVKNIKPQEFAEKIDGYLNEDDEGKLNGPLERYLIKNGKPLDFIGRLENSEEDLDFISKKLNFKLSQEPKTERQKNIRSWHSAIRNLWTEDLINFVREKEKVTIELMDYEFPPVTTK